MELCRFIGHVTGKQVAGITYRTNNISSLEEANVKLFISHVENELKIDNVFGDEAQKVFRKFGNFHIVLKGISKISNHKIVEAKVGRKGFIKSTKK